MVGFQNNLGLVRLAAAIQVALSHIFGVYGINHWSITVLEMIPGVPIFFLISGILIAKSYETSSSVINFYYKRVRRILPGLYIQTIVALSLLAISGYLATTNYDLGEFYIFLIAQFSFFQFYTPAFLKSYGVGSFNGIVWSVFVELQIYILFPYIYRLKDTYLIVFILFSYLINLTCLYIKDYDDILKYLNITFLPWIYYFLVGVLVYRNFGIIKYIKSNYFFLLVPIYFLLYRYFSINNLGGGNYINIICFFLLSIIILKISFGMKKYNIKFDISYGIYLYHMTFLNFLYYIFGAQYYFSPYLIIIFTLIFSYFSFKYVEVPFKNDYRKIS